MNINPFAQFLLPEKLFEKFSVSAVAQRLARGFSWGLLGSVTSRLIVLVSMILVARILGKVSFGEFGLIQATLGVAGLMAGLGLGGAATRFVSQHAKTDPDRAGRVIGLVMVFSIGTILVTAGGLVALSGFIAREVFDAPHLQTALIWGALLMAALAFRGIQESVFAALERFDILARLNVLDGAVSLLAMVSLAQFMGVEGALLGLALSSIIVWLLGRFFLVRELRSRGIRTSYSACRTEWRDVIGYSLPSFLSHTVATPVLWLAVTFLARSDNGLAELGLYQAAYQWHGPLIFIPMIFMTVSIPVLVQEWESGSRARFRKVVLGIFGLMLAVSLPPAALGAVFSPWIMELYGAGFREGWLILILLLAAAPFHGLAKVAFGVLSAMNRPWWILAVNCLWGVSLITLALMLIEDWGALGLATAFLLAYIFLAAASVGMVLIGSGAPLTIQSIESAIQESDA